MHVMTSERPKGLRKVFFLPPELMPEVDAWRREQERIPSESETYRELIRLALEKIREEREQAKKARK